MKDVSNLAMIEVVDSFLENAKEPQSLQEIIKYVAGQKEFDPNDVNKITQLYQDMTTSGKYIYVGDNKWDLKERNLEYWDKEGTAFISDEERAKLEVYEEDDLIDDTDFDYDSFREKLDSIDDETLEEDDIDNEELDEKREEAEYIDVGIETRKDEDYEETEFEYDEDAFNDDEEKYNDIMDDFEKLYDEE